MQVEPQKRGRASAGSTALTRKDGQLNNIKDLNTLVQSFINVSKSMCRLRNLSLCE